MVTEIKKLSRKNNFLDVSFLNKKHSKASSRPFKALNRLIFLKQGFFVSVKKKEDKVFAPNQI